MLAWSKFTTPFYLHPRYPDEAGTALAIALGPQDNIQV